MKKINDYVNSLTIKELVNVYQNEYLPFRETGILPNGVIRTIAEMFNELSDTYSIDFAQRLLLERCAELFFNQNK